MSHLVSLIDVRNYGGETVRVGDLNGDGAPDLLFVQSVYGTREITCLTAVTLGGSVIWQVGTPSPDNGRIYSDLPVQIHDWDDDGRNEVLYVRQAKYLDAGDGLVGGYARERANRYEGDATLVVLDAASGREKRRLPIPAPADDCLVFADLTGRGRRQDLVVKDRYWNMWGLAHDDGRVLWHWRGSTGHYPAVGDFDDDGRDEVFVGFALIDHDGRVVFESDPEGAHQDAAYAVRTGDGRWRLLFGNGGVHCLDVTGRTLWHHPLAEAQHVVCGRFRDDSDVQVMVLDRGQPRPTGDRAPATLLLYDIDGREIWRRHQPEGSWYAAVTDISWSAPRGTGRVDALVYARGPGKDAVIYDGRGEVIDTLPLVHTPDRSEPDRAAHAYATRADLWGDGREEAILFGSRAACVYANSRPLALPMLYNHTLYPGM